MPFQFLNAEGTFTATLWDDRALSPEQKLADPVFNPAWLPFSECLSQVGLELRADPSMRFSQQDLEAVLARVNSDFPDKTANRRLTFDGIGASTGSARTFLTCASTWLTKSPQEIYEITGVPNDAYPPKANP